MTVENVLLITIDSLRHDFKSSDAPAISELSKQEVSLGNAFATGPGTTPSFPGILSGTYPLSYGGLGKLSDKRPFLAEELRSHGFETAGFHSNPFLSRQFNYDRGFNTFNDYQEPLIEVMTKLFPNGIEKSRLPNTISSLLKVTYKAVKGKPRPYERAETITTDVINWLESASKGFFCWCHYMDVHHPCFPPESYLNEYVSGSISHGQISDLYSNAVENPESMTDSDHRILVNSYRASIRYIDDQVVRLIDTLREQGRFQKTLIIITSDHGQLFNEFGEYGKPYRMYDSLIKVPLIVANSPVQKETFKSNLVSLIDIPIFIHEVLNVDVPGSYEGKNIGEERGRNTILVEHQHGDDVVIGVRSNSEKYVLNNIYQEERAYEINYPEESRADITDIDASLREEAVLRLNEIEVKSPDYIGELDETAQQRLRDLGYL